MELKRKHDRYVRVSARYFLHVDFILQRTRGLRNATNVSFTIKSDVLQLAIGFKRSFELERISACEKYFARKYLDTRLLLKKCTSGRKLRLRIEIQMEIVVAITRTEYNILYVYNVQ